MYKLISANELTTAMMLQVPTGEDNVNGFRKKKYEDKDIINCNFKTYGGTEQVVNGVLSVIDTAQITTWYRPDITSDCRLKRLSDNAVFDILGVPENIEQRNQVLYFKVKRVKGGV